MNDLRALRGMAEDIESFSDEIFGFHAQPAVEKGLKSWLTLEQVEYPKIHDLEELFNLLNDQDIEIPSHFLELTDLVDFAVQFRYDFLDEDAKIDRSETIIAVS